MARGPNAAWSLPEARKVTRICAIRGLAESAGEPEGQDGLEQEPHPPLFFSSHSIGCQSSTLLPSGSITHANFPFS